MTDDQKNNLVNVQQSERTARAERILDAAAELVLRHGYRRVTIEDIATRAGIGKGTIYLHWKTRETLFYAMLMRESISLLGELLDRMRADPAEILPHRALGWLLERSMQEPMVAAMVTRDTDVLGKLVEQNAAGATQSGAELNREYLGVLREHGLLKTDLDAVAQLYAAEIIGSGFTLMEPWLPPILQLPLTVKIQTITHVLRVVLEPDGPPDPAALAAAAPAVIETFERMHQLFLDTVYGNQPATAEG
jgi:AcrR family transcriptional regulator